MSETKYLILGRYVGRYQVKLSDCIVDLHSGMTGVFRVPSTHVIFSYGFIRTRLEDWRIPSRDVRCTAVDEAFRNLLIAVCREYEANHLQSDVNWLVKNYPEIARHVVTKPQFKFWKVE